jgi:hypothetical protein
MNRLPNFAWYLVLILIVIGCKQNVKEESFSFTTPDEKILNELMVERCRALSARDMDRLNHIYSKNSQDLVWISKEVMPILNSWPARYKIRKIEKLSIIGNDAAGRFKINVDNDYKIKTKTVDVLYIKEDSTWKIESVIEL